MPGIQAVDTFLVCPRKVSKRMAP